MQQPHQELAGLIDGNYGTRAQVEESNFAARPCYHPATTGVGPIFSSPLPSAIIAIVPAITAGIHQSMVEFASWLAMSPTCWRHIRPTAKCRHFWPTWLCCANTKLIPTQYFCVGDGRHLPLSSFSTRGTYAQPAKNLYIRSLVYNTISEFFVDNNNTQQPT